MIGPGELFTLFFITLGPLKVLGPFAAQTAGLEPAAVRAIALRAFVLSLVAVAIGGFVGKSLAASWNISQPALLIATGVIFFLVAIRVVMEQYEPPHPHAHAALPPKPLAAALQLTFPTVVTPYGIAALIVTLAATGDVAHQGLIWGIVLLNLGLNLLAMLFAHAIMRGLPLLAMRLLGAVLGVLQVALAVQIILIALRELGLVT
jgi:multiple antibiotic resistance protein